MTLAYPRERSPQPSSTSRPAARISYAPQFRAVIYQAGLTNRAAAELLHVSVHTVDAWMKPETSKSANPVPAWAPELLAYKTRVPLELAQRRD